MKRSQAGGEARATAIRALLASPLLLRRKDEDLFRLVATDRTALQGWFEHNLGWRLHVDIRAGIARLHKRTNDPDPRRGLRRTRASKRAFDALRYQILALVCAELLRRPHATLGELADAVARVSTADPALHTVDLTRHSDRIAFVDALLWLVDVGAVDITAGELEGFGGSQDVDAVLVANTTLIPMLLSSDTAPSRIEADDVRQWIDALVAEPRYGTAATDPEHTDRDQRSRWSRHQAIRRLVDEPAMDLAELPPAVHQYLYTPAGRDKVLDAAAAAELRIERHSDVWLAVDPSRESTAATFSSAGRVSTAEQAAAIVLAALVEIGEDGHRRTTRRSCEALQRVLAARLAATPGWARGFRGDEGVQALLAESIDLLEEFGLVRRDGDELAPRPAAARFVVHISVGAKDDEIGGDEA